VKVSFIDVSWNLIGSKIDHLLEAALIMESDQDERHSSAGSSSRHDNLGACYEGLPIFLPWRNTRGHISRCLALPSGSGPEKGWEDRRCLLHCGRKRHAAGQHPRTDSLHICTGLEVTILTVLLLVSVGHEILATDHGLHLSPVSMAAVCSYHMAAYPGRRRTVSSRHPRAQCGLHPEAAVLLSKCLL